MRFIIKDSVSIDEDTPITLYLTLGTIIYLLNVLDRQKQTAVEELAVAAAVGDDMIQMESIRIFKDVDNLISYIQTCVEDTLDREY
jgi:hypothetical protein